jgi:tetratricopeptide (TPR) repeat protein
VFELGHILKTRLLVSLLIIPLAGALVYFVPPARTKSLALANASGVRTALLARLKRAPAEFKTGNFRQAAANAQAGYQDALRAHELQIATRFLNNLGGCHLALHQYREALQTYLEARRLTGITGDDTLRGKLNFNISTLYSQLNQNDMALLWLDRAVARLPAPERARQLPRLLIQKAAIEADQDHFPAAISLYKQGIAAADRAADLEMYASGWNDLGFEFLEHHDLRHAEQALLEAYRIRKLNRLRGAESCYRNLGMLRLEQGDTQTASVLLDLAVDQSRQTGSMRPTWEVHYARARLRLRQNRLREALDDLRIAALLARNWRRKVPPSDASRISAENVIQKVHAALIEAGNRLYFESHDPALAQETFESSEANRAASLRALLAEPRDWRRNLPPEYWETLLKFESAQVDLLRAPVVSSDSAQISELERTLLQFESQAGSNTELEIPGLLSRTRRRLDPDSAFFSFHLASPDSYLWAVSREKFALYRLPPGPRIAALVEEFSGNIRDGKPPLSQRHALFQILFGQLNPVFHQKKHWLLALDAQLFDLPFAALAVQDGANPAYLVERHSLEITPGAEMLALPAAGPSAGPFVAVADPIYNQADPRWTGHRLPSHAWFGLLQAQPGESVALDSHFARLAGSAREATACAAVWGGPQPPLLLQGASASRVSLQSALRRSPAVLHLATHVTHSNQYSGSGLIVLSLDRRAQYDVVGPIEIATWNLHGSVVVLSGCGSASAEALPATGLMGLTRACQAAGARAVIASHWPTLDDAGSIFLSFYRHLRAAPLDGASAALQHAQIDMLRSHTWRSDPRFWSAYSAIGNQP